MPKRISVSRNGVATARDGVGHASVTSSAIVAKIDRHPQMYQVNGLRVNAKSGTTDDSNLENVNGSGSCLAGESIGQVENSTADFDRNATSSRTKALVHSDGRLVQRCLDGDASAWSDIYRQFHDSLLVSIRRYLNRAGQDLNLVEEIAARVWYALVKNDFELLAKFDVSRGCRLSTYLSMVAKNETRVLFRSERRRRSREQLASRPDSCDESFPKSIHLVSDNEFLLTLSDAERVYFLDVLVASGTDHQDAVQDYSAENSWQLRHRVRKKLKQYVSDSDA